jgi:isoleucyl-tRNA synthetase
VNNFINQTKGKGKPEIEDKWILSKFNSLIRSVVGDYNKFKFPEAVQEIENFIVEDLSKNYIKIIRERSEETSETLNKIRIGILQLLAPIIPFTTERVWLELKAKKIVKEESIHLSSFPKYDEKKIDKELEEDFQNILKIIELGLAERDKAQIGLKWPLAKAVIETDKSVSKGLQEIISRQLNVKKIEMKKGKETHVELDTKMTEELELEGYAREISRNIQAERKKAGLVKENEIDLVLVTGENFVNKIKLHEKFIKERVNAKKITITSEAGKKLKFSSAFSVKNMKFEVYFSKL